MSNQPKTTPKAVEPPKDQEAKPAAQEPESAQDQDLKCPLHEIYPNASSVFAITDASDATIRDQAIVVLDTNALLAPYNLGTVSLQKTISVLKALKEAKRLIIPGHVAREFAKNRPGMIKRVIEDLKTRASELTGSKVRDSQFPVLDSMDEYTNFQKAESNLRAAMTAYSASVDSLVKKMQGWDWDPVIVSYSKLFTKEEIHDLIPDAQVLEEWNRRRDIGRPPGGKDARKPDNSEGDYVIWKTILDVGSKRKKPVLFVANEKKSDWWTKAHGEPLFPRFELQYEFGQASGGCHLAIRPLHGLLELFGADQKVVDEVRISESIRDPHLMSELDSLIDSATKEIAIRHWLEDRYPDWMFSTSKEATWEAQLPDRTDGPTIAIQVLHAQHFRKPRHAGATAERLLLQLRHPRFKGLFIPFTDADDDLCDSVLMPLHATKNLHFFGTTPVEFSDGNLRAGKLHGADPFILLR